MTGTDGSRRKGYSAYFFSTAVVGSVLVAVSCYQVYREGIDLRWLLLAALTAISANAPLKIPGITSKISVADIFVLMSMIFFGPAAGCIMAAVEALSGSVRSATKARRLKFALFNIANLSLCAFVAGQIFFLVLGKGPLVHDPVTGFAGLFFAAVILALGYYLLNSGTVALMVSLDSGQNAYLIWKENFLWHAINYFACTFAAVLISVHGSLITPHTLLGAGLMVMTLYAGYRNILGRFTANPHA
jgi:hypothetical protein